MVVWGQTKEEYFLGASKVEGNRFGFFKVINCFHFLLLLHDYSSKLHKYKGYHAEEVVP